MTNLGFPAQSNPLGSVVSHFESVIATQESSFQPSSNTQNIVDDAQPTSTNSTSLSQPQAPPARQRKRPGIKWTPGINPINSHVLNSLDVQQASKKSAVELRCLAEKHAQSGLTEGVFHSILKFHEAMEALIAMKALELGTTVSTIEQIFGKYIGVRRPSAWLHFLQSDRARQIFKTACGISSGEAMKVLGGIWANMDDDEKEPYKEAARATQGCTTTTVEDLDEELEVMDVGPHSRHCILKPRTNLLVNSRCLKQYKDNATKFLEETLTKCIPVAKSNHFEMVLIAVSKHIGKHNFQLTRNTAGVDKAVASIYELDGVNNFPAQMQAFLLGKTINNLAISAQNTGRRYQSRVVKALSAYLNEVTGLKHWPWTHCDAVLLQAGYELKLLPGARSAEKTLKTCSSKLNQPKLLALEADLNNNLIQLVKITHPTDTQPSQIDGVFQATCHTNQSQINIIDPSLS